MLRLVQLAVLAAGLGGCVQPYVAPRMVAEPGQGGLASQDQMAGIEQRDRVNRFRTLATAAGIVPPVVQEVVLPGGSVDFMSGPVPVVRVVFPERAFFAFDSAVPLPGSGPIFDLIAENMRHDVPDAALTVLGHTDAIGTDPYNIALSRRRAAAVMAALAARGIGVGQLSEVAIGSAQPIAPNATAEGRALNRRVEFLISPAISANLAAVQQYSVPERYFDLGSAAPPAVQPADPVVARPAVATVYQLRPPATVTGREPEPAADDQLHAVGDVTLRPAVQQAVAPAPVSPLVTRPVHSIQRVPAAPVRPVVPVEMAPVSPVQPREVAPAEAGVGSY